MPEARRGTIAIEQRVLGRNDEAAQRNRAFFRERGVGVVNLVSSPGAGKTTLLERLLGDLRERVRMAVVVGDLQTDNDARRLRGKGARVEQITTGTVCHLEADMVWRAISTFDLAELDVLIIENVGNLVCPAGYDLGEDVRIAVLATTEGEDKPLKYPTMFKSAHMVLINKTDIGGVVGFDRDAALQSLSRVAPQAATYEVSARTGQGLARFYDDLLARLRPA
jgi:hydrogenase nickel incorporation protein HypB